MYDIFYISKEQTANFTELATRFPTIKLVETIQQARQNALTRFYWIVWDDTVVLDTFDFEFDVDPNNKLTVHRFKNTNGSLGLCLVGKGIDPNTVLTAKPHVVDLVASKVECEPLDVVFISNGEANAENNWNSLTNISRRIPNKIHRVDGVVGRAAAYRAAANLSSTHNFFAVFAKISISNVFDWSWGCSQYDDRHYVFMATNPVNGLVYGHQAIIAYNKKLVLCNESKELDFTLAQPYSEIPMDCGIAHYNTSIMATWRTAFREAIKLQHYSAVDSLASMRLERWQAASEAPYGDWSARGAQDAIQYYESVQGDYSKLMLSYEWKWLGNYFESKYPSMASTT